MPRFTVTVTDRDAVQAEPRGAEECKCGAPTTRPVGFDVSVTERGRGHEQSHGAHKCKCKCPPPVAPARGGRLDAGQLSPLGDSR